MKELPFLALLAVRSLGLIAPVAQAQDYDDRYDAGATVAPLPDTGGPVLVDGLLLLGAGILGLRVMRRGLQALVVRNGASGRPLPLLRAGGKNGFADRG